MFEFTDLELNNRLNSTAYDTIIVNSNETIDLTYVDYNRMSIPQVLNYMLETKKFKIFYLVLTYE